MSGISKDYLNEYNALPSKTRKRIMSTLKYWGGWTKTSVYRKLACPNLSPIERILIDGVMQHATAPVHEGKQLEIAFDWNEKDGFILCL